MDVKKHVYFAELLDLYGTLLTRKQADIMRDYYHDNLSLGELAELEGISRTAVHDRIRQSTKKLQEYEEKLGLLSKRQRRKERLATLEEMCEDPAVLAILEQMDKEE